MKYTAIIAAALCAPLALAQGVQDPATAIQNETQVVEAAINELCEIQVKIVEVLETAKDRDSADAAAVELVKLIVRVRELQPDASMINQCDAATQKRLLEKLISVSVSIDARKKAVGKSLVQNEFYGSEDLKDAVRMML